MNYPKVSIIIINWLKKNICYKNKKGNDTMEKQPLVSIITPTYNHEKFIGQCIESVLAQSYPHWEQIVIDDGSADKTGEIAVQYKDERIKYIRQDNIGIWRLGETYNKALNISQGEFIAILEGDDFWSPDKLEKQIPAFNRQEVVLSWGKVAITNSRGETIYIGPGNLRWFKNRKREEVLRKLLLSNFIPACTAMCRKDALLSIGGFRQPKGMPTVDYPTWLELSLLGELVPVDTILGFWRRHEGQASATFSKQMMLGNKECILAFWDRLPETIKESLSGLNTKQLSKICQHHIAAENFAQGRTKLFQRDWAEARNSLRQALAQGSFSIKTEAMLGIICSYLRLDLEWTAALMGRPQLSKFL